MNFRRKKIPCSFKPSYVHFSFLCSAFDVICELLKLSNIWIYFKLSFPLRSDYRPEERQWPKPYLLLSLRTKEIWDSVECAEALIHPYSFGTTVASSTSLEVPWHLSDGFFFLWEPLKINNKFMTLSSYVEELCVEGEGSIVCAKCVDIPSPSGPHYCAVTLKIRVSPVWLLSFIILRSIFALKVPPI